MIFFVVGLAHARTVRKLCWFFSHKLVLAGQLLEIQGMLIQGLGAIWEPLLLLQYKSSWRFACNKQVRDVPDGK